MVCPEALISLAQPTIQRLRPSQDIAKTLQKDETGPMYIWGLPLHMLKCAAKTAKYYADTERDLTWENMSAEVIEFFALQWKELMEIKDDKDHQTLPPCKKTTSLLKWLDTAENFFYNKIGARNAPLA